VRPRPRPHPPAPDPATAPRTRLHTTSNPLTNLLHDGVNAFASTPAVLSVDLVVEGLGTFSRNGNATTINLSGWTDLNGDGMISITVGNVGANWVLNGLEIP